MTKRSRPQRAADEARRAITPAELRAVLALEGQGVSQREIAKRHGVAHTTIRRWLARADRALEIVAAEEAGRATVYVEDERDAERWNSWPDADTPNDPYLPKAIAALVAEGDGLIPGDLRDLARLHAAGWSYARIGGELGCPAARVQAWHERLLAALASVRPKGARG